MQCVLWDDCLIAFCEPLRDPGRGHAAGLILNEADIAPHWTNAQDLENETGEGLAHLDSDALIDDRNLIDVHQHDAALRSKGVTSP